MKEEKSVRPDPLLEKIKDKIFFIRNDLERNQYYDGFLWVEGEDLFRLRHLDGVRITKIIYDEGPPTLVNLQGLDGEVSNLNPIAILTENPFNEFIGEIKKEKSVSIEINREELLHLENGLISNIWHIKDVVLGKERSTFETDLKNEEPITEEEKSELEMYGYYSRKKLLDRLKEIEAKEFPQNACIG